MMSRSRSLAVVVIQVTLVLSVAAKYAWERQRCPSIWVRTTQFDPERILRGRYLALTLQADACSLPPGEQSFAENQKLHTRTLVSTSWTVRTIAKSGRLIAVPSSAQEDDSTHLTLPAGQPCTAALLGEGAEFFISERAKTPFPLAKGTNLWTLVTVPPQGPPRPVKLAISDATGFHPLELR